MLSVSSQLTNFMLSNASKYIGLWGPMLIDFEKRFYFKVRKGETQRQMERDL